MKIFKGKSFFFKSILIHVFLVSVVALVSIFFWEKSFYNVIVRSFAEPIADKSDVVLLMIDDKSTDVYRWPWARELYGEIVNYFNEYAKEKVLVFDSVISALDAENPEISDKYFFNSVNNSKNYISGFMAMINEYDNVELGESYDKEFYKKFGAYIFDKRNKNDERTTVYNSLLMMPSEYLNVLKNAGAVNLTTHYNGYLYEAIDLLSYNDNYYPSLALKAYMLMSNTDKLALIDNKIKIKDTIIPVFNSSGNLSHYIKYYKQSDNTTYSHKVYSAIDVIKSYRALKKGEEPIISPDEFNGKIVIMGGNSTNARDVLQTPISVAQPGADVQATILDNYINNDYYVSLSFWQNIFIIIFMCILSFAIIRTMAFLPSLLTLLCLAFAYFSLSLFMFSNGIVPYVITPIAVQVITMVFGYSYRFILEGRNKEKIKNAMGKYLSQDIMKNVVNNIDDIKLGGKKANVTVLFSDIRGFTSMSEKMTAEEVSVILNEYFSEMEPIITKYNGVINKFIGDAVMAIFGEPIQDINHAQNSVRCAYEMLKRVEYLREKWLLEGKPKIEIGIGINTGEAFVGNIGSEKRLEYTVIGDTVNLASRIEGYNKVYKTNLLISSSTYSKVSDIVDVIRIADVTIRGKSKKMDIYEVLKVSNK